MAEAERPIARKVFEEVLRMAGMLGVLITTATLLGEPAATKFVDSVITERHLASEHDIIMLDKRAESNEGATRGIQREVQDLGRDLDALQATSKITQELVTEQRQDIKSILRNLNEGGGR